MYAVFALLAAGWIPGEAAAQERAGAVPPANDEPAVRITFLDVGQGDAIVIQAPEGGAALVDAGPSAPLRYLQQMGVDSFNLAIASHPHRDHIGGMVDVLTARPVRFYLDNGVVHTTATYRRLMETVELLDGVTYLAATPRTLTLGSVTIEVLPLPDDLDGMNDRSVGLVVRYGTFSALLTGDSEEAELDFWTERGRIPDVTLLKAPHHGSVNGVTQSFLEVARPELVVVSVGEANSYGHPRPEALAAFGAYAERILRTDRDGHVTVFGYEDGSWRVVTTRSAEATRPDSVPAPPDGAGEPSPATFLTLEVVPGPAALSAGELNEEYAILSNSGPSAFDLSGLRLCDLRTRCFRFPPGARVSAGGRIRVYSGYGVTDGVAFFMNNDRSLWNPDGDEARLLGLDERVILRYVY